jgi:adenylate cyclase
MVLHQPKIGNMGKEIERKFLVRKDLWYALKKPAGEDILQGYLLSDPQKVVRVRTKGEAGYLTIKGPVEQMTRAEFEYRIPFNDAKEILNLCQSINIEKTRYTFTHEGHTWEVDEFFGANDGLIIAEIELNDEQEPFHHPSWLGEEVTQDMRYYNSYIAEHPFNSW